MRKLVRLMAVVCFALALSVTLCLWHATGGGLFTQLPSEALAKMQEPKGSDDAFAGLGMNDLSGAPTKVDNSFRFGLLPAGPGHGFADSASVLTLAGPALLLLILVWCSTCRAGMPKKA